MKTNSCRHVSQTWSRWKRPKLPSLKDGIGERPTEGLRERWWKGDNGESEGQNGGGKWRTRIWQGMKETERDSVALRDRESKRDGDRHVYIQIHRVGGGGHECPGLSGRRVLIKKLIQQIESHHLIFSCRLIADCSAHCSMTLHSVGYISSSLSFSLSVFGDVPKQTGTVETCASDLIKTNVQCRDTLYLNTLIFWCHTYKMSEIKTEIIEDNHVKKWILQLLIISLWVYVQYESMRVVRLFFMRISLCVCLSVCLDKPINSATNKNWTERWCVIAAAGF